MEDIITAKKILDTGFTVVVCYKGMVLTSKKEYSIALNEFIDSKLDFKPFSLAIHEIDIDNANLILKLGLQNIATYKISSAAKELFDQNNLNYKYNEIID